MAVLPFGSFPLGFRFCPTDVELVNHYLKKKISGRNSEVEVIPEVDVCKCEPWDLPGKSVIQSDDPEWFFFSPRDRKYPNGQRSNRATEAGYWKATGKDRMIKSRTSGLNLIGMKKTLVFYRGRAPNGERTNWVMHEYRVIENETDIVNGGQGGFVLCRLFRKPVESGKSPNCDEVEPTGLSPSTIQSSPDDAQHARDDVHQFETELNEVTPDSDVQEGLAKMTEEQQLNIEMLLADKADDGTSCPPPPESLSNSIMASDVEDCETEMAQTEVDSLLESLEMFYEPTFSSLDPHFYSHLESEMLQVGFGQHYLDSPFYDAFENKQQTKLFQNCPAGQEASFDQSDAEFLDSILIDNHDECLSPELVRHAAAVDSSLGVKISGGYQSQYESQSHAYMQAMSALKSISGIGSVSRSGADAEITVPQMDQRPDVSEKWFSGPGLPNVESKVYLQIHAPVGTYNTEVYTDQNTEAVEHQGYDFNQPANERSWGNSSDTGTGIKIRHRQQQPTANTKRPITHGFAPQRIHLQMKFSTRPMFGMGREVLCDAENQEADTAVSEEGENVEDMKTEGSGVSGPCNSENIEYHSDDGGPHTTTKADATSDLADIHLPDEFQKKALLLDTDTNNRIIQVPTAKRRLRTKKMGEMGTIHKGPSLKHGASNMGFSSVFVVCIALFLIISTVFWVLELL